MTHDKLIDTVKVLGVNVAATGVSVIDFNSYLTTISILLAICYTIWKWHKDWRKNKNI